MYFIKSLVFKESLCGWVEVYYYKRFVSSNFNKDRNDTELSDYM